MCMHTYFDKFQCNWTIVVLKMHSQDASMSAPHTPHKGLKLLKRFTILPLDFSGCMGEKRRSCLKRRKKLGIQLKFCIFYISSLFHPRTHNLRRRRKKHATLCSEVCEPFRKFQLFVRSSVTCDKQKKRRDRIGHKYLPRIEPALIYCFPRVNIRNNLCTVFSVMTYRLDFV